MKLISLTQWLTETALKNRSISPSLGDLIVSIAEAGVDIASTIRRSYLTGLQGTADSINVQDEQQKKLDIVSNDIVIGTAPRCGHLAAIASEENEDIIVTPCEKPEYLLLIDPLDGSSNLEVNVTVGTIFSIYRRADASKPATADEFLQSGRHQVAAGYIAYGPATQMVLSLGSGVVCFTLDPETAEFRLTADDLTIGADCHEFAVNASRRRFWLTPFSAYIDELLAGQEGPRGKNYNMRWIASMVADVHRILTRGGIFMYPVDQKIPGRLRLMYEANPMAFLIEQAGGRATDGRLALLDIKPDRIHQRVGVILGARNEVDRLTDAMTACDD